MDKNPHTVNIDTLKVIAALLRKDKHYHFARELRTIIGKLQCQFCSKEDCDSAAKRYSEAFINIKLEAEKKFEVGAKEHITQSWNSVDHLSELQEELLDAYNYLEGLKTYNSPAQISRIQHLIVESYRLSNRLKKNPKSNEISCPKKP